MLPHTQTYKHIQNEHVINYFNEDIPLKTFPVEGVQSVQLTALCRGPCSGRRWGGCGFAVRVHKSLTKKRSQDGDPMNYPDKSLWHVHPLVDTKLY